MDGNAVEEKKVIELSIDDILPNRFQPRIKFEDNAIFELSESIKTHGVFQPIIVRPIGDKYEIIAGERRYKASVLAGKTTIPAIVMHLNDNDTIEVALVENVQRANLTPIEEAISYRKILDMGYINQEQLAQKLGKTQSTIANKLRLLNLDDEVQEALLENKISERHARSLLKLKKYEDQRTLLKKIIDERLTVRKTDEEIDKMLNNQDFNNNIISDVTNASPITEVVTSQPTNDSNTESSFVPPVFGDINNEVINPAEISTGVINSIVISSDMQNKNVEIEKPPIMDIQSIETNASDVNVVKPVAPMDQFLTSASTNSNTPFAPIAPEEDTSSDSDDAQALLKPGKFFNFAVEEEKPEPVQPDYNAQKNFNFDDLYKGASTSAPIESSNVETPLVAPATVDPFASTTSIPSPVVPETPSAIPSETPSVFGFGTPNVEEPTDDIIPITNNISVDNQSNQMPSSTPFGFGVTNEPEPNINQPAPVSNDLLVSPAIEEPQIAQQPEGFATLPTENNVMNAIGIIRNAISEVERLGFEVDVDEIDLESIYQLIIKVEK